MRKYVEELRRWHEKVERAEVRRQFKPQVDHIVVVHSRDVGVLGVDRYADRLDLRHIEIVPDYQGQGLGSTLIGELLAEAQREKLPVTLMVLKKNPAKRLYERLGFRVTRETLLRYVMTWMPNGRQ
jgi:ribosomal protein S18 acetylase RimI-like enzyme